MRDNLSKVIRYMVLRSKDKVFEALEAAKTAHTQDGNFDSDAFLEDVRQWIIRYDGEDNIGDIDYSSDLTDAFYFCRYGFAYAFEYYFIYRLVLRDMLINHGENRINIDLLSLGCGSLIDLWGMKYALATIDNPNLHLTCYTGYDMTTWAIQMYMHRNFINYYSCCNNLKLGENDGNILNCFGEGKTINHNVITFAKIINELERVDGLIDELINRIQKTNFPKDEYYICFSHSKTNAIEKDGLDISYKICSAICERMEKTHNNQYIMNSDILGDDKAGIFNEVFNKDVPLSLNGVTGNGSPDSVTYCFEEQHGENNSYLYGVFIEALDNKISVKVKVEAEGEEEKWMPFYDFFTHEMREYIPESVEDIRVAPVNHLTPLTFQIVKISRAN